MSDNDPLDVDVLKLISSDFTSIGSEPERGAVLGGDLDVLILFGEHDSHKVEVDRRNDDVYI